MNRYSKALKHIKSTQIEEKIKKLEESTPTNNTDNLYSTNPQGFNDGPPDPAKAFYPDQDGDWPSGIPGDEDAASYLRPPGFWTGEVNWDTIHTANVSQDEIGSDGKSTAGVIADDGTVKTILPENTRDFILGPLVDGYVPNHTYDAYTNIGYLQKDTRQFVLLGRITGQWKAGLYNPGVAVWDGGADDFTSYNDDFTLAHAQWFQAEVVANNYVTNAPYFYSGGVPQQNLSGDQCPTCPSGMKGGVMPGGGGGGNSASGDSGGAGWGTGGTPDIGSDRSPGTSGNAGDVGLWGLVYDQLKKGAKDFWQDVLPVLEAGKDAITEFPHNFQTMTKLLTAIPIGANTMNTFMSTNDPESSDFGRHSPGHRNYEGPKQLEMSAQSQNSMKAKIDAALERAGIDTTTARNLKPEEIVAFSDEMKAGSATPKGKFKAPVGGMDFYATFHSLPPDASTVEIKPNGGIRVRSNYVFTDKDDVSIGGALTQNPMTRAAAKLKDYYDKNPDEKPADVNTYHEKDVWSYGRNPSNNPVLGEFNQMDIEVDLEPVGENTGNRSTGTPRETRSGGRSGKKQSGDQASNNQDAPIGDTQIAGGHYGMGYGKHIDIDGRGWMVSPEQLQKMKTNPERFNLTPSQIRMIKKAKINKKTGIQDANYEPQGKVISESRKIKILREVKKPYKMPEIPKHKYKMNFSGKYSAQNTPDKTASKVTDALIASGNDKGHRWRTQDKYWQGYETTERMNIVYDKLGHAEQAWNMITEKNGWKDRDMQEHLNILAHEKQMLKENPLYESPFYVVEDNEPQSYEKDPLYKKVKDKLNKELHYKDRPSVKGYPNEPPPEMVNGWHPKFGKRYKYDKLDPQSAEAMPDTGDPEIDANIEKATDKKAKTRKSKVLTGKTEQFSNWRDDLTDA